MSPDELSSEELEQNILDLQKHIDSGRYPQSNQLWARRIERYRGILQERAEVTHDLESTNV